MHDGPVAELETAPPGPSGEDAEAFAAVPEAGAEVVDDVPGRLVVRANGEILRASSQTNPVLAYLESLPSENSKRTMRDALRRVVRTTSYPPENYENVPWWLMGPEHAGVIRARLLEQHSIATVKVSLAALKGVLEQCFIGSRMSAETLERIRLVLKKKIRGGRLKEPAGRMLEDAEIVQVRKACLARGAFAGAMYDAIIAAGLSGLRRDEIARALVDDVSGDASTIQLVGKGAKEARIPLASWASCAIDTWLAQRAEHPFKHPHLFVRISDGKVSLVSGPTKWVITMYLRSIAQWSGVKFTAHDLRRTFISTLAETQDMFTATSGARHSDPKTTAIYDRRPFAKLARAVEESTAKWGKL